MGSECNDSMGDTRRNGRVVRIRSMPHHHDQAYSVSMIE